MGSFYYPLSDPAWEYVFYASVNNDLRDAIELAEKLRKSYDEIYLIDPQFNHHMREVSMSRWEVPSYLRVLVSEKTSSRIAFTSPDKKVKRVYLFFEKAGFVHPSLADTIILVSIEVIAEGFLASWIDASSLRPSNTLMAYK